MSNKIYLRIGSWYRATDKALLPDIDMSAIIQDVNAEYPVIKDDGGGGLPDQTGNNGKFLKTDGSAVSWDTPAGGGGASYLVYTALLNYAAPETITSGLLKIGEQYTITTYAVGDDFTNVGAASNGNGVTFIATGTTPTDYSNGSTLDSAGLVRAIVLQNTLGGNPVWEREGVGYFVLTLAGAFPKYKQWISVTPTFNVYIYAGFDSNPDSVYIQGSVFTQGIGDFEASDFVLSDTYFEVRVYP